MLGNLSTVIKNYSMRELIKDKRRLEHILDAIDRVLNNTDGMVHDDLHKNDLLYFGIVKCIEIIGEAAYRLTKRFRDSHPETPWDYIIKMRHVLVHDYYQIDDEDIWIVIEDDLKPLKEQIVRYIDQTDWIEWENLESEQNPTT